MPGPLDNVVVDLSRVSIDFNDYTDDVISSLTVTGKQDTLALESGILDLSGSGVPGTFDVPGTVDFSKQEYGNVYLNGAVLASANVTSDTAISVLGATTSAIAQANMGEIDGGVLNGTIEVNDGGYAALDLEGNWVNNGTITVNSSTLILGDDSDVASNDPDATSDAWVNNGTIATTNCTVNLGGWLTYGSLATLNLGTDTVDLIGTVDNSGQTLTFSPLASSSTGSWSLLGGRIDGGTIAGSRPPCQRRRHFRRRGQ